MGRDRIVPIFRYFRSSGLHSFAHASSKYFGTTSPRNLKTMWIVNSGNQRGRGINHHVVPYLALGSHCTSLRSTSSTSQSSPSSPENAKHRSPPDFSNLPGIREPKVRSKHDSRRNLEISKEQALNAFRETVTSVKTRDFDNFAGALLAPKVAQPALFAILALNVELAVIRDKIAADNRDTSGIYRLQFWKDSINSIYVTKNGPIPRQPVAVALCSFAPKLDATLLLDLVSTRQESLGDRQFATISEAISYGSRTWGSVIKLLASVLKPQCNAVETQIIVNTANKLGAAFFLANMIRSAFPLLARGVVLLPADLCTIHAINLEKLVNRKQDDESKSLIRDIAQEAQLQLESARKAGANLPHEVLPAFIACAATCEHVLRTTASVQYSLFESRLQRRNPLQVWKMLWRRLRGVF